MEMAKQSLDQMNVSTPRLADDVSSLRVRQLHDYLVHQDDQLNERINNKDMTKLRLHARFALVAKAKELEGRLEELELEESKSELGEQD